MPDEIATAQTTNDAAAAPADTGAATAATSAGGEASAGETNPQPAAEGGAPNPDDDSGLLSADGEEGGEPEDGDKDGEPEKPAVLGAPEGGYQFEGFDPANAGVAAFSEAAKSLDLSQDSAKQLMDTTMAGMKEELQRQRQALKQQALSSKELGFSDAKVANQANGAYGKYFGGAENANLRAKLRAFNLDVDPDFLRAMKRIGADISEGGFVQGKKGARAADNYRALFPNTKMNE